MKKIIVMVLLIAMVNITSTNGSTNKPIDYYLDNTVTYITEHVTNPGFGSVGGDWTAMAVARYGALTEPFLPTYKANIKKTIQECKGNLSDRKYTEYARAVIGLSAVGENPREFGGYNLLKPLAEFDKVASGGLNTIVYTLIAFDCKDYSIPEPSKDYEGRKTTRDNLIEAILKVQKADGGWSLYGGSSDTDMTAITIQSLAPYYGKKDGVKTAVDRAIEVLGTLQNSDGGFSGSNAQNCESTAQVLIAMSTMNISINDSRFVKNGKTVLDGLLQYYDNGAFKHTKDSFAGQMSTDQAFCAMVAYYRSANHMNSLYDMKDGIIKRAIKQSNVVKENKNQYDNNAVERNKNKKKNLTTRTKKKTKKVVKNNTSNNNSQEKTEIKTKENGETKVVTNIVKADDKIEHKEENISINEAEKTSGQALEENNVVFIACCGLALAIAGGCLSVYKYNKKNK